MPSPVSTLVLFTVFALHVHVVVADAEPHFLSVAPRGASCERKDEDDSTTAQCQGWCRDPNHCDHCKCRACSLCTSCDSAEPDDTPYASCEPWCSVRAHCNQCKCKACDVCRACEPSDANDIDYEDCQPWCRAHLGHCNSCKCASCTQCKARCTAHNAEDGNERGCEKWCQTPSVHCTPSRVFNRAFPPCVDSLSHARTLPHASHRRILQVQGLRHVRRPLHALVQGALRLRRRGLPGMHCAACAPQACPHSPSPTAPR